MKRQSIMNRKTILSLVAALWFPISLLAQTAPVTTAGMITNATTVPGSVIVPVTVSNFHSIGAFTLTLRYRADRVTYVSAAPHASFPGMTVTNTVAGTLGKLVINWPETPGGITLPDATRLLDLTFTYLTGTSPLLWLYSSGNVCQYKKYSGGNFIMLADTPKSSFYLNGGISDRSAPVTTVPYISNALPGNINVPVTVDGFTAIGAMSLTLEYDQDVLSFQGCTPHGSLGGTFNAGSIMGPNGKMVVTISWFGLATLPGGSTVATIAFSYNNALKSYSTLEWYDAGSSCEYADAMAIALLDAPTAAHYHNGAIFTQEAPGTWLPELTGIQAGGGLSLPVYLTGFSNIRSFTLGFEYDPAVMTYANYRPDAAFGTALSVTDLPSGGSKRMIILSWNGTTDLTLPDGTLAAMLYFISGGGQSTLTWVHSGTGTCRFNDAGGNALFDLPKSNHYRDGSISSRVAPIARLALLQPYPGQPTQVPMTVDGFSMIAGFSYAIDYDPAVLIFQGVSPSPMLGGAFSATLDCPGRIILEWNGPQVTLADGSELLSIGFTYMSGSTPLAWYDDGGSCSYVEQTGGTPLYDHPANRFYINGYVGTQAIIAAFNSIPVSGATGTAFQLNDQTTGLPDSWAWNINPSTYYFINGTGPSSQNPSVRFTEEGQYSVTLVASRGMASSYKYEGGYLTVGTLANWTGTTSGDWFTPANWQENQVPPAGAAVRIPALANNWPHLTGDLTIGTLCKSITLEGPAQLTVDGDLTILAGSSLQFTGNGHLYLGGDWINSGVLWIGSGTVEFTGTEPASIVGGSLPETFWVNRFAKTASSVQVNGQVHIIGTSQP